MGRPREFDEAAVLDKAMNLFWQKGFKGTSMQEIVDHLGINRASLYATFGDKHALFLSAFEHYRQARLAGLQEFLDAQSSVKEGLRALLQQTIDSTFDSTMVTGCFISNTTIELVPEDQEISDILAINRKAVEKVFYNFLQSGVQSGEISPDKDIKAIAAMIFTYYNGLNVMVKIQPSRKSMNQALDAVLSVLD